MGGVRRFSISVPSELAEPLDILIRTEGYANRSQAIAEMIRDRLIQHVAVSEKEEVIATITLLYDHHRLNLVERLTTTHHAFQEFIAATLHIHLDATNCLEVIVIRGNASQVRRASDALASLKGIRHAQTTLTAVL